MDFWLDLVAVCVFCYISHGGKGDYLSSCRNNRLIALILSISEVKPVDGGSGLSRTTGMVGEVSDVSLVFELFSVFLQLYHCHKSPCSYPQFLVAAEATQPCVR